MKIQMKIQTKIQMKVQLKNPNNIKNQLIEDKQ